MQDGQFHIETEDPKKKKKAKPVKSFGEKVSFEAPKKAVAVEDWGEEVVVEDAPIKKNETPKVSPVISASGSAGIIPTSGKNPYGLLLEDLLSKEKKNKLPEQPKPQKSGLTPTGKTANGIPTVTIDKEQSSDPNIGLMDFGGATKEAPPPRGGEGLTETILKETFFNPGKFSLAPTEEQIKVYEGLKETKKGRIAKSLNNIFDANGSLEDITKLYKESPEQFEQLRQAVAPGVLSDDLAEGENKEDNYLWRVYSAYKDVADEKKAEMFRDKKANSASMLEETLPLVSRETGKQYRVPQSLEETQSILKDIEEKRALLEIETSKAAVNVPSIIPMTISWDVKENTEKRQQFENSINKAIPYLKNAVSKFVFEKEAAANPNITPHEVGKKIYQSLYPQQYKIYELAGGDKAYSAGGGFGQGYSETPKFADRVNRDITEFGINAFQLYGNKSARDAADVQMKSLDWKYTLPLEEETKHMMAAELKRRGINPREASEEEKDVVAESLPEVNKDIWFEKNKPGNNVYLPSTGFGFSLKNSYHSTVEDGAKSLIGWMMPNRTRERALNVLGDQTVSETIGENPESKQRLSQLREKEKLTPTEAAEKKQLEEYTDIRTNWQKFKDLSGMGVGQFAGFGTISAFTGGLGNAKNIGGAVRALISPAADRGGMLAAGYLMSFEPNAEESTAIFPDKNDGLRRFVFSNVASGIDTWVERLFPEEKFLSGVLKKDIARMIPNLTAANLRKELNAGLAEKMAKTVIKGIAVQQKTPIQEGTEELISAKFKSMFQGMLDPGSDPITFGELIDIGTQAYLSSQLLGVPKGLMAQRNKSVPLNAIWDAAADPKQGMQVRATIEDMISKKELTQDQANERISLLNTAEKTYKENPVLSGDMGGLSLPAKQNYLARLLNEKLLQKKADETTDAVLKKQYELEIKESQKVREQVYKKEVAVNPRNDEIPQSDDLWKEKIAAAETEEEKETLMKAHGDWLIEQGKADPTFLKEQSLDAPNGLKEQLGSEQAVIDEIAKNKPEEIEAAIKTWQDKINSDLVTPEEADAHISLLEKGLQLSIPKREPENISQPIELDPRLPEEKTAPAPVSGLMGEKDKGSGEGDVFKQQGEELIFYNGGGDMNSKTGIYFTTDKDLAKSLAEGKGAYREELHGAYNESKKNKDVSEAKLVMSNPKKIQHEGKEITTEEIEQYKKEGYDSVISYANGDIREAIVFDKSQIKPQKSIKEQLSKNVDAEVLASSMGEALRQTINDQRNKVIQEINNERDKTLKEDEEFMKGRPKSEIENSKRIINKKYDEEIKKLNERFDKLISSPKEPSAKPDEALPQAAQDKTPIKDETVIPDKGETVETIDEKTTRIKAELIKRGLSEKGAGTASLIVKALEDKDAAHKLLHPDNKNSRELWSKETGMALPKTVGGTKDAIDAYFIIKDGGLKPFEDIVNNSGSFKEAFDKVKKLTNVSKEVAKAFRDKYDPKKSLTPEQTFEKFYNEVKSKNQTPIKDEGLAGSEKSVNSQNETIISQRLRPEEEQGRTASGSLNAEATNVLQRLYGAIKKTFGSLNSRKAKEEIRTKEQQYLQDYTEQTGQWFPKPEVFGKKIANGQEQEVYHKDGDTFVTKLNDLSLNENTQDFLDRVALHNANFPSTAYEVIGFGKNNNGDFVVITKQPLIKGEVPTRQEIVDYMKGRGFRQQEEIEPDIADTEEAGKNFVNDNVIVEDLHRGNVIKGKDGEMFVIDPDIKLNSPDKGFGGTRKIVENETKQATVEGDKPVTPETGKPSEAAANQTSEQTEGNEKVPPKEPPVTPKAKGDEESTNKPKAILNRINDSTSVSESFKDKFRSDPKGLRYDPKSHEAARQIAVEIVDEFGEQDAVAMAESGRFDGDVNSMIFAEAIDRTYSKEQSAITQEEKIKFAEQWADFAIRYDETAREKGRFISAIYDFYKKSPLGVVLSERAKRDEAFKEWFQNREKPYQEVFDAIKDEPEFKELVEKKVIEETKKERAEKRQKRRDKIIDIFDKGKIKGGNLSSSIVPPQVWNAAVEVMKQAALTGESILSVIEKGVEYIKTNHKEAWDEPSFRNEWGGRLSGIDGKRVYTDEESLKKKQERILERFRKKLTGLSDQQKEDVIRNSFKQLVENGALEYDEFKKIIADVMGLGELTAEEITKLNGFINDINAVQDAADNVMAQTEESKIRDAIKNFDITAKKAEDSATKLAGILYNKPNVGQRIRSVIQLNTLGIFSLIKNVGYNVFNQIFVRIPKAIYGTALDQAIYGLSFIGNKIFGSPIVKPDVNIFLAQKGFFDKGAKGGKLAINQLFTGLTNKDYFQKEVNTSQIKPITSIKDLWNWGRGNKHLSKAQIADKAIQATVGIPAEIIARGLNIGDKPFRFAAEGAAATTIGRQQFGFKGVELERFMRFPKEVSKQMFLRRGSTEEVAIKKAEEIEKRIISEGEQAVFQQENLINDVINGLKKSLTPKEGSNPLAGTGGEAAKMFGLLNLPYVKTPVNIMWEFFNLMNPELALLQSFIYGVRAARNGSREDFVKSKKWLSHAATGYSILAATAYIASIGALSGDDEDEAYKAKEAKGKGTYAKPHAVNISKLQRAGLGESLDDQPGDLQVDLVWWGPLGSVMNFQANKYENMTETERKDMGYVDDLLMRLGSGARDGLVNTTFRGGFDAVNALTSGRTDGWIINMMNVGTNFIEPATIAQISRANRKYEYQVKGDSFSEKLQNNLKARFFGKVQPKVNIWGEKMEKGNPVLSMLGVNIQKDNVIAPQIHKDFQKTGNSDFYPPAISGTISVDGEPKKLNTEQQLQMETLVGKARATLVAPFSNDDARIDKKLYSDLDEEGKVEALQKLYSQGYDVGKKEFIELYPEFMSSKKKKK